MVSNKIVREDIESFSLPRELAEQLRDKTIIVTGATGLVGSTFVRCIDALKIGVKFILPVRNADKAKAMFSDSSTDITTVEQDLCDFFRTATLNCDYIIHCASPTDGRYMCEHPADTFMLPIDSTHAILEYARLHSNGNKVGVVFLSSIEYYGQMSSCEPVTESTQGHIDRQSPRSSYALGKQAAEYLCYCYAKQYGVAAKSARLTQTFGAGIPRNDNRVFAQFARSVIEGKDIVLHTHGKSSKPYCYSTDCVSALVYILLKGENGEAYNIATPGTFVSVLQLAHLFRECSGNSIDIRVEPLEHSGYAPDTLVNLNSDKLQALGWSPRYSLPEMIDRLVAYLRSENSKKS